MPGLGRLKRKSAALLASLHAYLRSRIGSLSWFLKYWHVRNYVKATADASQGLSSNSAMKKFRQTLAEEGDLLENSEHGTKHNGVKAVHFVYGLKQVEVFPFYAAVAVLSAQARHPNATTFFYYHYEPVGPYWDLIKSKVKIIHVPNFDYFGVAKINHYAHKADVVRLLALCEIGGLYLDLDSITLRSMDELTGHPFVMGVQPTIPGAIGGLCNAIMLGQRRSRFINEWLKSYRSFRSNGRDPHWDFHSVKLPVYIYARNPEGVHILDHDKWFFPLWPRIQSFMLKDGFNENERQLFKDQLAIHLWHTVAAEGFDRVSPQDLAPPKSLYATFCLEALEAHPDAEQIFSELGIRHPVDPSEDTEAIIEPHLEKLTANG